MLGSFCVQADLGDWEEEEHGYGIDYIRDIPFAPPEDQTPQLLEKIAELHRDRRYGSVSVLSFAFAAVGKKFNKVDCQSSETRSKHAEGYNLKQNKAQSRNTLLILFLFFVCVVFLSFAFASVKRKM